jgi:hypothetical protein
VPVDNLASNLKLQCLGWQHTTHIKTPASLLICDVGCFFAGVEVSVENLASNLKFSWPYWQ